MAKRIGLAANIGRSGPADNTTVPVTQGIPFADGELRNGAPVRVIDGTGRPIPTQALCLATWNRDALYVKWLLVDFQLAVGRDDSLDLFLEYGDGVEPLPPAQPVAVQTAGTDVRISTGALELEFHGGDADFFKAIRVASSGGWRDLLSSKPGPFLHMTDGMGTHYDSFTAAPAPKIVVEDHGPMRASVHIEGYHASADARRFCPYVLRIHAYAGRSDIRVFHTFVFDQDPDRVRLREMGLRFPVDLGAACRTVFGGETEHHAVTSWNECELTQVSANECRVSVDGETRSEGGRSPGWAYWEGTEASVAVVLRDMWQEHPKVIAFDADGIDIQFLPGSVGEPLNLETPWKEEVIRGKNEEELLAGMKEHPRAGVGFKGFLGTADLPDGSAEGNEQSMAQAKAFAEKHLQGRRVSYGDTSWNGSATGLAKTHELWLDFREGAHDSDRVHDWAGLVQQPPIAPADPSYMCATGALRILAPKREDVFPEVEAGLELMFDKLYLEPVRACGLYGMIDYGDLPNCHLRNDGVVYRLFQNEPEFKITDLIGWFNNEGMDLCYTLWQYFARTGQRKYWTVAEANSEHVEDVDTIHTHPTRKGSVGRGHYHNMLHWSGGPSPSHTHVHGWLLHYFFTGNRRAIDVAREAVDATVGRQELSGVLSNRSAQLRREFTSPLASLWAFYETTWEERYGDCARRSLKLFLQTQMESGQFPRDIFTDGARGDQPRTFGGENTGAGGMEGYTLYDAYRITGDPEVKRAIVALADSFVGTGFITADPLGGSDGITAMSIPAVAVAHAYQLTGDERYVSALEKALAQFPEVARQFAEMKGRVCFRAPVAAHQYIGAALAVARR